MILSPFSTVSKLCNDFGEQNKNIDIFVSIRALKLKNFKMGIKLEIRNISIFLALNHAMKSHK